MSPDAVRRPISWRAMIGIALVSVLAEPVARATQGGTITDGDVAFSVSFYGASPTADLTGFGSSPSTDHLYRSGWWYRFAGDTQETPFPIPDSEAWSGSQADLEWDDLDGSGLLDAHETIVVVENPEAPGNGLVTRFVTLYNPNAAPVDVDLIHFADIDLEGNLSNLNDSAELIQHTPERIIALEDSGGLVGAFVAGWGAGVPASAVRYRVASYDTLRTLLNDASLTSIGNTGLPFGPGDLTAAYEFRLSVPAQSERTVLIRIAVGLIFRCGVWDAWGALFCDGFESGSTSIWSAQQP